MHMKIFISASVFLMFSIGIQAQSTNCEVLMESIKGTYTGECSGNKANGEGKSTGTDSYDGTFKNGLPNGTGKYTWQNGDYYTGEWRKGMKEGKGELHRTVNGKEAVVTGFWKKDVYKGKYLKPYLIHDVTSDIGRVEINRIKDSGTTITIEVQSLSGGQNVAVATTEKAGNNTGTVIRGTTTNISMTEVRVKGGRYDSKATNKLSNSEITILKNVMFPFRASFVFGSNSTVDIEFFEEGEYTVSVPVQNIIN